MFYSYQGFENPEPVVSAYFDDYTKHIEISAGFMMMPELTVTVNSSRASTSCCQQTPPSSKKTAPYGAVIFQSGNNARF
jgi:hypothetical protein